VGSEPRGRDRVLVFIVIVIDRVPGGHSMMMTLTKAMTTG
jgi:hypothetical protein